MDDEQGLIIYNTPDGKSKVALMARDGMVWLNQQSIAELFRTSIPNVSMHISNIFRDKELKRESVVKDYLTTASDGKPYHMKYYSLPMIISIGYKVKGKRGVEFRRWATELLLNRLYCAQQNQSDRFSGRFFFVMSKIDRYQFLSN